LDKIIHVLHQIELLCTIFIS